MVSLLWRFAGHYHHRENGLLQERSVSRMSLFSPVVFSLSTSLHWDLSHLSSLSSLCPFILHFPLSLPCLFSFSLSLSLPLFLSLSLCLSVSLSLSVPSRRPWQQTLAEVFGTRWKLLWFLPFRSRRPLGGAFHPHVHV